MQRNRGETIEWERLEISSTKLGIKGTFRAKMGTINDRNSMDLTEADEVKKRWHEYTKLYKKDLHDPVNQSSWCDHSPRARHPGM